MPVDEIVRRCLEGDRRSQQTLFDRYAKRVHAMTYRMLGPRFEIDEVIQQVFVDLFQSLAQFKGLSSLDTWVYRLTVRTCTDQLRKKYRKRVLVVVSDNDGVEELADRDGATPLSNLELRETRGDIQAALEKLSPDKRAVIVLYEMEGRGIEEIAEIVHAPPGTIKSRLFHARNELKKHLRQYLSTQ